MMPRTEKRLKRMRYAWRLPMNQLGAGFGRSPMVGSLSLSKERGFCAASGRHKKTSARGMGEVLNKSSSRIHRYGVTPKTEHSRAVKVPKNILLTNN